eukprot:1230969-Prymnesium_polylepis.2
MPSLERSFEGPCRRSEVAALVRFSAQQKCASGRRSPHHLHRRSMHACWPHVVDYDSREIVIGLRVGDALTAVPHSEADTRPQGFRQRPCVIKCSEGHRRAIGVVRGKAWQHHATPLRSCFVEDQEPAYQRIELVAEPRLRTGGQRGRPEKRRSGHRPLRRGLTSRSSVSARGLLLFPRPRGQIPQPTMDCGR